MLLPYGLETSSELLASHGIILPHNEADYLPLYQDLVELVGDVSEIELAESVDVARGKLEVLQNLDAAEAPLAARPGEGGSVGASGHLLGCLQVAYAATDELGFFEEEFDREVGHFTIRPRSEKQSCMLCSVLYAMHSRCREQACDRRQTRDPHRACPSMRFWTAAHCEPTTDAAGMQGGARRDE